MEAGMNKYIMEREISKIETLGQEQLREAAAKRNHALDQLRPGIQEPGSPLKTPAGTRNNMFRDRLHKALAMCALLLALIVPATAQSVSKATIPFDFRVGNVTLSAGEYTIERVSPEHVELLALRDSNGQHRAIINGIRLEPVENNGHARLLFTRYNDRYFLSQIWPSDSEAGASVPKTRLERELAGNRTHRAQTKIVEMAP